MKKLNCFFATLLFSATVFSHNSFAHSGGTDSYGCHTNHSTGVYHCHNPKKSDEIKSRTTRGPASVNKEKSNKENKNSNVLNYVTKK
ncbi:YHYH domain-containing protein [Bacteriovorax stolpii]|uniref:YHYH domain-containing protein n=1 Tax=Bacteriovorax stolpii TaxID=960 RepID=A0A2K9NPB7_BACTC|nr:YHYH domain-containing protein [Bacteriovorax stolpii]